MTSPGSRPHGCVRNHITAVLGLLLAAAPQPAADLATDWIHRGPGTGGGMPAVFPHPNNPDVVLTSADMVGPYRTDDGAATWEHCAFQDGTGIMNLVFDPDSPDVIFVEDSLFAVSYGGLFRSGNLGERWTELTYCDPPPGDFYGCQPRNRNHGCRSESARGQSSQRLRHAAGRPPGGSEPPGKALRILQGLYIRGPRRPGGADSR